MSVDKTHRFGRNVLRCAAATVSLLAFSTGLAAPEPLQRETMTVATLAEPQPHWLLVNDPNFLGYMDSRVNLLDADSGRMLGQISTGGYRGSVEFNADFSRIYSPETYYPRVTRGERTEVVTAYDVENLTAVDEVIIPPRRATGAMLRGYNGMSTDGRFMYVANMTPAMSVTVVDLKDLSFASEIATSGCMVILPNGPRSFAMLCGDGTALQVTINDDGTLAEKDRSAVFFDAATDPVTEKAARIGSTWYVVSFQGRVYSLSVAGDGTLTAGGGWSLTSDAEHAAGWRPGGPQLLAAHGPSGRLFVTMNDHGDDSHKDSGAEIWVMNAGNGERIARFQPPEPVGRVAISHDDEPVLVASGDSPAIYVLDPDSGDVLRVLEGPLLGAGILQFPRL